MNEDEVYESPFYKQWVILFNKLTKYKTNAFLIVEDQEPSKSNNQATYYLNTYFQDKCFSEVDFEKLRTIVAAMSNTFHSRQRAPFANLIIDICEAN